MARSLRRLRTVVVLADSGYNYGEKINDAKEKIVEKASDWFNKIKSKISK